MKFFHLSDLHIGLKLYNRDLYEDQAYVFSQICDAVRREQPDAILIAGDIYDRAIPSAEAVALFDRFTLDLSMAAPEAEIMMISGNHDSAPRLNVYRRILERHHLHMIGQPPMEEGEFIEKVTLEDGSGPVNFYLLPFVKPSMVRRIVGVNENGNNLSYDQALHALIGREDIDETQRNVLVSHQFYLPVGTAAGDVDRCESEMRTVGNIDQVTADVLERFDYAALGHIHKPMKVGSEYFRYCGTPLPCSVSEAGQQKQILMVDMGEKGQTTVSPIPLTPLHQVRILKGTLEEILTGGCEDYVSVRLTDEKEPEVTDVQDRLRHVFPNLLDISWENLYRGDYVLPELEEADMDPFSLCCKFLRDPDQEEMDLLQQIINEVLEEQK